VTAWDQPVTVWTVGATFHPSSAKHADLPDQLVTGAE
jgi:hypothetical protein